MILTKEEFLKEFEYNALPAVHRLVREGKIKLNADDMIDTADNEDFCKKRKEKLKKNKAKGTKTPKAAEKPKKNENQLSLEIDMFNSRLSENQAKAELLRLKVAKEKGKVVETNVLNTVIRLTFDDMIKTLTEFPNIYAMDIINIVHAEENPKEILVEYLTNKITESLKMGLNNAKMAAKKYYKDEE